MTTPATCGITEADGPCTNVARYTPTIHVYHIPAFDHRAKPSLLPIEIQFHHLPLCRHHKQFPDSLLHSLWSEVQKELSLRNLSPSNSAHPWITFATL